MSSSDPSFIGTPISGAVAAVLTIAQAVPAIDKRLARVHEIESQLGPLPNLVTRTYVWMQQLYKWVLIGITFAGIMMVLSFIFPKELTHPIFIRLRDQGLLLIVIWLVVGAAMYTNILSRIVICCGWLVTRLFREPLERHSAWHALWSFIDLNESAKPLLVAEDAAVRFANSLVSMLKTAATTANRAVPPSRPQEMNDDIYRSQVGNGLLAACVIEEAHYDLRMPNRDWTPFYAAVSDVVTGTELFSVKSVLNQHKSNSYYDTICLELNRHLQLRKQEPIPDAAELGDRLMNTFTVLANNYGGNTTQLHDDGKSLDVAYKRLETLPVLKNEGMRANFVKLGVVWEVWRDVPLLSFDFPFSKRVAALLMDRGVILAPDDVKTLAFDHPRERQVQRAAVKMVINHAIRLIESRRTEHENWLPAKSRTATGEFFRWWVAYELDYRLWDYAAVLHNRPTTDDELSQWHYAYGQVVRTKKS
jgi:hypothetical protein